MNAASPELRDRLAKLLGLLGSDHDGEVAAAGRRAHKLLTEAKLTWHAVIAPPPVVVNAPEPAQRRWREPRDTAATIAELLRWPEPQTAWELDFLRSVAGRHSLTEKQEAVLERIFKKVRAFALAEEF